MTLRNTLIAAAFVLPTAAMAQDYTGPSVGAQLSFGDAEATGPALEGDNLLLGLRAYYDFATASGITFGVGIQYDDTDLDLNLAGTATTAATATGVLRLAGRVGGVVAGSYLYGTAGFAELYTDDGAASAGNSDGYFLGVGYERYLTDQWTIGAEVLYHEFDDFAIPGLEADVTTIGVSANFRF